MSPALRRSMLAAVLLLVAAWLLLPGRQLPLYDGIGFPDEPYRYVERPPGVTEVTAAPTTARMTLKVPAGISDAGFAQSAEQGPQVSIFLPRDAVRAAQGTASVQVTLTPLAPVVQPEEGSVYGNVYRLSATASQIAAPPPGGILRLRAPDDGTPTPVMHQLVDGRWQPLKTDRLGTDVFGARIDRAGDYAMVRVPQSDAGGSGGGLRTVLIVAAGVLLLVTLLLALVRRRALRDASQQPALEGSAPAVQTLPPEDDGAEQAHETQQHEG